MSCLCIVCAHARCGAETRQREEGGKGAGLATAASVLCPHSLSLGLLESVSQSVHSRERMKRKQAGKANRPGAAPSPSCQACTRKAQARLDGSTLSTMRVRLAPQLLNLHISMPYLFTYPRFPYCTLSNQHLLNTFSSTQLNHSTSDSEFQTLFSQ